MISRRKSPLSLGLGLALALAGCAGNLPATTAPQPAPTDYAKLAAAYLPKQPPVAGASISAIQPAVAPQPGEWFTCFRYASGETYAVFFAEGKITEARNAVGIDRCDSAQGYRPWPPPKAAVKPASKPANKKKSTKG